MGFLRLLLVVLLVIIVARFLTRLFVSLTAALRGGPQQRSPGASPPQRYRDVKDAEFEDLDDNSKA